MKVLFATSWYPSKLHATLGNFVERHVHAVQHVGHEVVLVHIAFSNRVFFPHICRKDANNVKILHLFIPRIFTKSERIKRFFYNKLLKRLAKMAFRPEVVHGNVLFPIGDLAVHIAENLDIPLVFTEHWNGYKPIKKELFTPYVRKVISRTAKKTDVIMPVSEELGACMRMQGFEGKYEVVNNAVDASLFYPIKTEVHKEIVFTHISNFAKQAKNPEGIIRAFANMNSKNAKLIMAGDGDLQRLIAYTKSEGIDESNIQFMGTMEYEEVAALMRKSDCHVLFSNFENLPCVIAEAHCCGIPIISTNVGGVPEMVDNSNGILIEPEKLEELTGAFELITKNIGAYDKGKISEVAMARYSFAAIGKHFTEIYKSVIR